MRTKDWAGNKPIGCDWRRLGDGTLIGFLGFIGVFTLMLATGRGASPGLQLGGFSTNLGQTYLSLTITNGSSTNAYEIHTRPSLNANFPWIPNIIGTNGQTNFLIEVGPEQMMFFRALACTDCDNDGVLNWQDGNPNDTNVARLTITILSPANNSTVY